MKEKRKKKVGQVKATDEGLEGFIDWGEPTASEPTKKKKDDMYSLAARFTAWMCKWPTCA